MNKLMMIAASTLLVAGMTQAMPADRGPCSERGPRNGQGPNFEQMQQRLGLTDAQAAEVKNIMQEQRAEGDALRQEHCKAITEHRDKTRSRLSTVLTAEQLQQFDEQRQNRMHRGKQRQNQAPAE